MPLRRDDVYSFPEPSPYASQSPLGGSEAADPVSAPPSEAGSAGPSMTDAFIEAFHGKHGDADLAMLHRAEAKAQQAFRETTCDIAHCPVRLGGEFSFKLVWQRRSWWGRLRHRWKQRRRPKKVQQPSYQPM